MTTSIFDVYEYQHLYEVVQAIPAKVAESNAHRVVLEISSRRMVVISTSKTFTEDDLTLFDYVRDRPLRHIPFETSLLKTLRGVCDSLPQGEVPHAIVCGNLEWFASERFPEPTSLFGIPLLLDRGMSEQTVMVVIANVPFALKGICRSVVFSIPPLEQEDTESAEEPTETTEEEQEPSSSQNESESVTHS